VTDTPETDAQLTTFTSISKLKRHFVNRTGTVSADFARKLERERDEARDTVLRLRKQRAIARNFGEQMERERDEARRLIAAAKESLNAIHVEVGGWIAAMIKGSK
jgi:hypothetical protein